MAGPQKGGEEIQSLGGFETGKALRQRGYDGERESC